MYQRAEPPRYQLQADLQVTTTTTTFPIFAPDCIIVELNQWKKDTCLFNLHFPDEGNWQCGAVGGSQYGLIVGLSPYDKVIATFRPNFP